MNDISQPPSIDAPGLVTRRIAADVLGAVIHGRRPVDQILDSEGGLEELSSLEDRDRALVHMLVAKTLRRLGTLREILGSMLERGFPKDAPRLEISLLLGATQILFLAVPDHAAVDLSVQLVSEDRTARRYTALANAVLRRIAREGAARLATIDPIVDTPEWLMRRWIDAYGEATAREIAAAHAIEPSLDLSAKENVEEWAAKLAGIVLPTGSIRVRDAGSVLALPGFEEGAWWVQDAAASLPVKLLGDVGGRTVADLCAAPGGKTAQLLACGAKVIAVDRSAPRLKRLRANLERLQLNCEIVETDAAKWQAGPFDAVLIDAPCTSTGTIRRNPDLPWHRTPDDLAKLSALQTRLLDHAVSLVRPGGILVYATCSLEPEECERQIEALLSRLTNLKRVPIEAKEIGNVGSFVSSAGDLRTFPHLLPNQDARLSGCDGFYAARLQRLA